ncbi:TlyA family RNA methyltransferase [Pseudanabaena sp. FACHB-1277]|uniref:TlyA family RNA methyltransferase n=1 Tax=Pseudanabaena cinerea FACHB-1277 TaxID=2949581 RepID=A0A926Z6G6_9CYAN|nr:TlyA family RNA methyltransferase [Pseudanabaena cinerea]MBD2148714.1 TlyA family RNA methyltransferase [Pseudanabaena cinerea FACHB-1277]
MKKRLDVLLVDLELAPSREQAQKFIRAGWVQVNQAIIDKPGTEVKEDAAILVKERSPFVSRGGEKLAGALAAFAVDLSDRICFDGGISTGGFTDCMLKQGASKVYGVDVGYGQVAWEIRSDERVVLRERTNLRHLTPENLYGETDPIPDFAVLDLSFISLTKILPALWALLRSPRETLLLVKPQFEAGKGQVGKNGIVREPKIRAEAIAQVLATAQELGWQFQGLTPSPIQGRTGNFEYWLWLSDRPSDLAAPIFTEILEITQG